MTSYEGQDFSTFLSFELYKNLGISYQSSLNNVWRFDKGDSRLYIEYEREREEVVLTGLIATGGITLLKKNAFDFIKELKEIHPAYNFRIDAREDSCTIFPEIHYGLWLKDTEDKDKLPVIMKEIKKLQNDLEKVEDLINKYKKKEVILYNFDEQWEKVKDEDNVKKKGKYLENFFTDLIRNDSNFEIHEINLRTESEEIDLIVVPTKISPFWAQISAPMILIECKNWREKVGAKEIRDFAGKIMNRPRMLCNIGFFVTISGFTKDANKELLGYRGRDFILATITGDEIENMIESDRSISDTMKKNLLEAGFR